MDNLFSVFGQLESTVYAFEDAIINVTGESKSDVSLKGYVLVQFVKHAFVKI